MLVSLFVLLCGCSTETTTKKVNKVDQERDYYLKETKPYIEDMLFEFNLIYDQHYKFAINEIMDGWFSEVDSNLEASDRRYRELRTKAITEPIPNKGLRDSHKEKLEAFKKNFILVCDERAKASSLLLQDMAALGDERSFYNLTGSLDASLKLITDGNAYFYIGISELFSIEDELNIESNKEKYNVE